jgi:ferric-dicitrate binding protein FerR (iron transport regulator)
MNLCNRCQLRVVDAKAGSVLISGSVDAGSIDAFVSLLSSRFGVSAENRSDDEIVLALAGRDRTASFEPPAPPVLADPSPRLVFSRTPLAEAVAQMNLYNRRKLVVADDATGSVLVSGRVEANNVDGFVSLLSIGFGVSAEGRGETETVLRK